MTTALTVAGSDSGGGAGIQADLKTFAAHGVHGTAALTAVTAQNTLGVQAVEPLPPEMVVAQIDSVLDGFDVRAIKTGMLPNARCVDAVRRALSGRNNLPPLIVDPVMVATSGDRLADPDVVDQLLRLASSAELLTPNRPEAEALLGRPLEAGDGAVAQVRDLLKTGVRAVLLKGGHDTGDTVQDWLVTADGEHRFEHPRLPGRYHGTGCTLSAAIAAQRARGEPLHSAVEKSLSYLRTAMRAAGPARCGDLLVLDHGAGVAADGPPDRD